MMRSDDAGVTLRSINAGLPMEPAAQLAVLGDQAFAAYDQDERYSLYASNDGGESWSLAGGGGAPPMQEVYTVRITPDGSAVLAGASDGLFQADLAGDMVWHQKLAGEAVFLVEAAATEADLFYLATWDQSTRTGRLLRWRDSGETEELAPINSQPRL